MLPCISLQVASLVLQKLGIPVYYLVIVLPPLDSKLAFPEQFYVAKANNGLIEYPTWYKILNIKDVT